MPSKLQALRRGTALTRAERKELGPVQIVVLGFDDLKFEDEIVGAFGAWRWFDSSTR
jgi:hypothetical protein